jgi:hypothetical protein
MLQEEEEYKFAVFKLLIIFAVRIIHYIFHVGACWLLIIDFMSVHVGWGYTYSFHF